jgi:hypothetical protein
MDWQQVIALAIVVLTAMAFLISYARQRRRKAE